jgi:DNA-binding SARP family transcriptional activator/DNA-binding beta-propeller fold protein YncE
VEYRLLGPVEALRGGVSVDLGVYKQRALFALLLINANHVVSTDRIIDELWGEDAGRDRQNALWVAVSRLRTLLEPDRERRSEGNILLTRAPGYTLVADPTAIDAFRFESLASEGRALLPVDPAAGALVLSEALALWRGHALEEFTFEPFAAPEIARLEEMRLVAVEERLSADLELGRAREVIGELESLVRQHPMRERLAGHLMLALFRSGRQAEALRAFTSIQEYLADELGLEPSAELVELEERILLGDASLLGPLGGAVSIREPGVGLSVRGYELREEISSSAIGTVYRAYQPALGREVAVKVIPRELSDEPDFIRRFETDAHLRAGLEHPSIPPVLDYWREPGAAYLVVPRLDHPSLSDVVDAGTLSFEDAIGAIRQVTTALVAAHRRGLVHGSLRPSNVLMDHEGRVHLMDFGLSAGVKVPSVGRQGEGTVATRGQRPARAAARSDLVALGALADILLVASGGDSLPRELTTVVTRARSSDPDVGYPDVVAFLAAFEQALGSPTGHPVGEEVSNPYRGLRAFGEKDADSFFGRERLVERLISRLGHPGPQGRLLVLVGPSGSGKSSVIRAGLVPALRQAALPRSNQWFIVTMTPGRRPFAALADAVGAVAVDPPDDLVGRLSRDGLRAAVEVMADPSSQLMIVVDQLEELFSLSTPADADAFLSALADAATDRWSRVKIVATLRADFYDPPLRHRRFGEALRLGTEVVTPMRGEELHRAIALPAETLGVTFEPGLVTAITADMSGQPAALPLLQYLLTELFEARDGATISSASYRDLGGVTGALARRAESVYTGLSDAERAGARDVFLRLVTVDPGHADTRRRTMVSELEDYGGARIRSVLEMFGRHRLVTFDRDPITRIPTVEIAHEALFTEWSRLSRWIEEARLDISARRRLGSAAREWNDAERKADLLFTGSRLESYADWIDEPPLRLTVVERQFLEESKRAVDRQEEGERRRMRRLRRLILATGSALVVALVAGGIAVWQQRRAQVAVTETRRQAELAFEAVDRAELATLISRSAAVVPDDPELALLLALEANRRSSNEATEAAVLSALGSSSLAKRIVSISPLPDECVGASFLPPVFDGQIEFATVGGRMLIRDPVVGEVVDLGPPPGPCAVGATYLGVGAAVSPDLMRGWFGADFAHEMSFATPTRPEWVTRDRVLLRSGLFEDEPDIVALHDLETGDRVGSEVSGEIWLDVAVSDDESLYAISFVNRGPPESGVVYVIAAETGQELSRLVVDGGPVGLAFDPASEQLFVALLGGRVLTVDPQSADIIEDVQAGTSPFIHDMEPRSDGMLWTLSSGSLDVVDPDTGATTRVAELSDVSSGFIRPDGLVVTRDSTGQIEILDPLGSAVVDRTWRVEPSGLTAFHSGRGAVLDSSGRAVEVVDLTTGERFTVDLERAEGGDMILVAFPEDDGIWAVSSDHELTRWKDGHVVERIELGSALDVEGIRFGRTLTATRFGDRLAVLGRRGDGTRETSIVTLGTEEAVLGQVVETPEAFIVHPTGDGGLHSVTEEGVVRTYNSEGIPVDEVSSGQAFAYVVALDPSGRRFALGSEDGGLRVVDLANREVQVVSETDQVINVGFGPDGRFLAIALADGTVRLWDVEQATSVGLVWNGQGGVTGEPGWYDPTSGSLWMGWGGALIEIPLESDRWVARACEIVGRELTATEWGRYVPGDQPQRSACG